VGGAPTHVPALRDALTRLLADDELRTGLGRAGRARAGEQFGTDREIAALLDAYASATAPRPA
jgi:glycosyltransferase involved in cell wall biosynthesis